jgi:hypothetical protein
MELGGSDALVVLADADLDKTVRWALWGRMNNGGQCCVASKRMIVVEERAGRFLERFKVALADLKAGDPFDASTTLPPMCPQEAADQLADQVKAAVDRGPAGDPVPATGAFVQPTILTGVSAENPAYLLAAIQGERRWGGLVFGGERGFRGGSGCGGVACDDTVSVSDKGRPSPVPFGEVRGGP